MTTTQTQSYSDTKVPQHPTIRIDDPESEHDLFSQLTGLTIGYLNETIAAVRTKQLESSYIKLSFRYTGIRVGKDNQGITLELLP